MHVDFLIPCLLHAGSHQVQHRECPISVRFGSKLRFVEICEHDCGIFVFYIQNVTFKYSDSVNVCVMDGIRRVV
jgi:hypothetical protein